MARQYADRAAYEAWTNETAPDNVDALLRTASRLVDVLLRAYVYDVDAQRMPTDPDVAEAMEDATVAIAQQLHATGALAGTGDGEYDTVKIGNVSLSGKAPKGAPGPVVDGVAIPMTAVLALRNVGHVVVWT